MRSLCYCSSEPSKGHLDHELLMSDNRVPWQTVLVYITDTTFHLLHCYSQCRLPSNHCSFHWDHSGTTENHNVYPIPCIKWKHQMASGLQEKLICQHLIFHSAVLFSHDLGDTQEKEASKIKGCVLLDTTLQPLFPCHWTFSKTINMGLWDGHRLSYPGRLQNLDFDEQTKCFLCSYWERMKLFPDINPWHLKLPNQYKLSSDSHPNTLQININPNEGQKENNWLHFRRQRKKTDNQMYNLQQKCLDT